MKLEIDGKPSLFPARHHLSLKILASSYLMLTQDLLALEAGDQEGKNDGRLWIWMLFPVPFRSSPLRMDRSNNTRHPHTYRSTMTCTCSCHTWPVRRWRLCLKCGKLGGEVPKLYLDNGGGVVKERIVTVTVEVPITGTFSEGEALDRVLELVTSSLFPIEYSVEHVSSRKAP